MRSILKRFGVRFKLAKKWDEILVNETLHTLSCMPHVAEATHDGDRYLVIYRDGYLSSKTYDNWDAEERAKDALENAEMTFMDEDE